MYMSDPPRIYPALPEYIPLFNNCLWPCPNPPLPPRIYPPFKQLYATQPESTPPSQNIPPFSTNLYVRPSHNLSLPPRIYSPFQQVYATLPESTPPSQNIPPFQQMYMCDPPRIYPSLPEYTPLFNN